MLRVCVPCTASLNGSCDSLQSKVEVVRGKHDIRKMLFCQVLTVGDITWIIL